MIICPEKEKTTFYQKIGNLQDKMKENEVSISSGVLWEETVKDIADILKQADQLMYRQKEAYHQRSGDYRR